MRYAEFPDSSSHPKRREAQEAARARQESEAPASNPGTPGKVLKHRITANRIKIADIFSQAEGKKDDAA